MKREREYGSEIVVMASPAQLAEMIAEIAALRTNMAQQANEIATIRQQNAVLQQDRQPRLIQRSRETKLTDLAKAIEDW